MATARIEYPPSQDHVVILPEPQALRPPGVGYIAGETLQAPIDITHDLPAENVLRNDIEQLCNAILTIDKAFYDIGQKLSQATKEQKKRDELYKTCYDLETRWKQHHESYKKLLWRSREVAGKAQFVVDDFSKVFLPCLRDSSTTLPERRQLVQKYVQKLEEKSETSQNLSQEFLDFVGTLEAYIADFSLAVEGLGFREQTEKCHTIESRLHPAKAAMDCVIEEVRELGWKLARDVVVTGITLVLAVVAPMWSEKLAEPIKINALNVKNSGTQLLHALRKCEAATREYNTIKSEFNLEKACLDQMVKLESTLYDARPVVHSVTMKLGAMANVWAAIAADIRQIVYHSQSCGETQTSEELFVQRVQRLEALYGCLSEALRYYQVTVWLPGARTLVESAIF